MTLSPDAARVFFVVAALAAGGYLLFLHDWGVNAEGRQTLADALAKAWGSPEHQERVRLRGILNGWGAEEATDGDGDGDGENGDGEGSEGDKKAE